MDDRFRLSPPFYCYIGYFNNGSRDRTGKVLRDDIDSELVKVIEKGGKAATCSPTEPLSRLLCTCILTIDPPLARNIEAIQISEREPGHASEGQLQLHNLCRDICIYLGGWRKRAQSIGFGVSRLRAAIGICRK